MDEPAHGNRPRPPEPQEAASGEAAAESGLRTSVADAIPLIARSEPLPAPGMEPAAAETESDNQPADVALEQTEATETPTEAPKNRERSAAVEAPAVESEFSPSVDPPPAGAKRVAPGPDATPVVDDVPGQSEALPLVHQSDATTRTTSSGPHEAISYEPPPNADIEEAAPAAIGESLPERPVALDDNANRKVPKLPNDHELAHQQDHTLGPADTITPPIATDALQAPPTAEPLGTPPAALAAASADIAATPVREEQIWFNPEVAPPPDEPPQLAATTEQLQPYTLPPMDVPVFAHTQIHPAEPIPVPQLEAAAAIRSQPVWTQRAAPVAVATPSRVYASEFFPYLRLAARALAAVTLVIVATLLLLVVLYRWLDPPTSTLMVGQRLTGTAITQTWVPIERISPNLVSAVILSEDGAFCRHRGVDWAALEEAIESSRGGSTITMQVVKNLFLWPSRSYLRKALEIMLAYLVEAVWPKQRVLEIYLNIAEWGPGVFGAEAAARHHYGKAAAQLTAQEAALLAVALPSPLDREAGYPGYQQRRLASNLLARMKTARSHTRCVRVRRGEG